MEPSLKIIPAAFYDIVSNDCVSYFSSEPTWNLSVDNGVSCYSDLNVVTLLIKAGTINFLQYYFIAS